MRKSSLPRKPTQMEWCLAKGYIREKNLLPNAQTYSSPIRPIRVPPPSHASIPASRSSSARFIPEFVSGSSCVPIVISVLVVVAARAGWTELGPVENIVHVLPPHALSPLRLRLVNRVALRVRRWTLRRYMCRMPPRAWGDRRMCLGMIADWTHGCGASCNARRVRSRGADCRDTACGSHMVRSSRFRRRLEGCRCRPVLGPRCWESATVVGHAAAAKFRRPRPFVGVLRWLMT
jgi:hypothetical protein